MNKLCGIYQIVNKVDSKRYIGKSKDILHRWCEHRHLLKIGKHHSSHLQNAWNKYGCESFDFSILETCPERELNEKECYYIKVYKSYDPEHGYNLTYGGDGVNLTDDQLIQFRDMANCLWGIPILQIDLSGNIVKEWRSARECSRVLCLNQSCIYECLTKKRKTYAKFIWIFKTDVNTFNLDAYYNFIAYNRMVYCFNTDGLLIKQYNRVSDVSKDGYDISSICKSCSKNGSVAYRYIWSYKNKVNISDIISAKKKTDTIKIYRISLDGVKEYIGIKGVLIENPTFKKNCILDAIRNSKLLYGYLWKTEENYDCDSDYKNDLLQKFARKRVFQYTKDLSFVCFYKDLNDAEQQSGVKKVNINNCIYGRQKTAGGYVWKYD